MLLRVSFVNMCTCKFWRIQKFGNAVHLLVKINFKLTYTDGKNAENLWISSLNQPPLPPTHMYTHTHTHKRGGSLHAWMADFLCLTMSTLFSCHAVGGVFSDYRYLTDHRTSTPVNLTAPQITTPTILPQEVYIIIIQGQFELASFFFF